MQQGKNSTSGKYNQFFKYINKCNADGAKTLLERLNAAAEGGNYQVFMWILELRFPEEFGRRVYRKTNVISENKNANIELIINDTDAIRNKILDKLPIVGEL